ncbi:flagellar basal body-associated FliL family protein [Roseovarius sp. SYSU LYC5161]|jgi:flagellar basal body-associated protein FliL|uniref:flagellar basal body-associated FliL family protein n=1 Tax=Roseovarius halophilus (ex Wu et al. 2025) TaxID=3376060 RepID=UPI002872A51C|nr:flagellar basal body-associated FliL family protein [Roseovarius sp.]
MIRTLLLAAVPLLAVVGGAGAGYFLKAGSESSRSTAEAAKPDQKATPPNATAEDATALEYVKLNNQFVVPIVTEDRVDALVVMSLSVEVAQGSAETVYTREPKLRDALLQVLFDHANLGGFEGRFTDARNMDVLRTSLFETARGVLGDTAKGVLVTDIARQDV